MPFNIDQWKSDTKQNLQGWKSRMERAGMNSAYYFLAGVSLLPIAQAVHGGDWSGLAILGASLGGAVSTNLLANIVQKCKDKSDVEVAHILESEVNTSPELKAEIDAMLQKLDALQEAEKALSIADKTWFVDLIQHELKNVGSGIKYEAHVTNGAAAQGNDSVALAANATCLRDVVINMQQSQGNGKEESARQRYLRNFYNKWQALPLVTLGDDPGVDRSHRLDDVYISLNTTSTKEVEVKSKDGKETEKKNVPIPVLETALQTKSLVLLGDPGSGKTTFVYKLLTMQARALLGQRVPELEGIESDLMPVLVTLRDLVPALDDLDARNLSAEQIDSALVNILNEQIERDVKFLYDAPAFIEETKDVLSSGRVLLAFDGLDEVPDRALEKIRMAVAAYKQVYDISRMIVTCRIRSYGAQARQPGFTDYTLAQLTNGQIRQFTRDWYLSQHEMGKTDTSTEVARKNADDLFDATRRDEIRKLATNPMLLTTMAVVHQKQTELPKEQVKLYSLAVKVLVEKWQAKKTGKQLAASDKLTELLNDHKRVRRILERLAYEAHQSGKNTKEQADISRKDALWILDEDIYAGSQDLAKEFLNYVDTRAGLLVGRGGESRESFVYSFAHRTFQEYLAGCYLFNRKPVEMDKLFREIANEPEHWSLAVIFGAEELMYNGRTEGEQEVLAIAYRLLDNRCATEILQRLALWTGKMAAVVGRKIIEKDETINGGKKFLDRLIKTQVKLIKGKLTPIERADAGNVLAKLGDPREEITTIEKMVFCRVPAGEFTMGDEKEAHQVDLPEFYISRFPISNAQFEQFVKADGYKQAQYWREAEEAGYWSAEGFKGGFDGEPRNAPDDNGAPFNLSNHPVVGVSWYESLAFTRWLTAQLQVEGYKLQVYDPTSQSIQVDANLKSQVVNRQLGICLPSEAEWEKAARGTDGRKYPWGEKFNPNFANVEETGIGTTSALGCFLSGISPYGLLETSGNVWEWTRSNYKDRNDDLKSKDDRVLRGGSFYYVSDGARCAYRDRDFPGFGAWYYGFRVVVSPILPS